jgi:hypothetical protein
MTRLADKYAMMYFHGCPMCNYLLEQVGPMHGPDRPPVIRPSVERWSMSPEEWFGQT